MPSATSLTRRQSSARRSELLVLIVPLHDDRWTDDIGRLAAMDGTDRDDRAILNRHFPRNQLLHLVDKSSGNGDRINAGVRRRTMRHLASDRELELVT